MEIRNKKSQVTIFIIIIVIVIAAIIGYFLLASKNVIRLPEPSITDPNQYIDKCTKDASMKALNIMLPQGGYINPTNFKLYNDNKVGYLCYTNLFYITCTMQEPVYINHLQNEITQDITPVIDACFHDLKSELESKGYSVSMGNMNVTTEIVPNMIRIKTERLFSLDRGGETKRFESFSTSFNSPLYGLARVAQEIASQESKYCNFEYLGFMILYPKFNIDKKSVGEGLNASKIYVIEDIDSGKKLDIAIRSCAIPPGF